MRYKYLIVGGGIAGTSAAFEIRKRDDAPIAIIGSDLSVLYNRILLPHYLKGELPRERLFLKRSEDYETANIDLWSAATVIKISPSAKMLLTSIGEIEYEKLLIATGGTPKKLTTTDPVKTFNFQDLEDAEKIDHALKHAKNALVIGGGFIALEFLGILLKRGVSVTSFNNAPGFFPNLFDETADRILTEHLEELGVKVIKNGVEADLLALSKSADFIGVGIGIDRNIGFLEGSSIKTNIGVVVNEYLEASIDGVYAAGDVAEFFHPNHLEHLLLGNWINAQNQGKLAGANMASERNPYSLLSNYSTSAVGLNISTLGETNESKADRVITLGSAGHKSYARIYMHSEAVVGALLINRTRDLSVVSKLIKDKTKNPDLSGLE